MQSEFVFSKMKFLLAVIILFGFIGCRKDPLPPQLLVPCYQGLPATTVVKYSYFDGRDIVRSVYLYDNKGRKILDSVIFVDPPVVRRRITYTSDTTAIDAALNQPLGYYTLNKQGYPVSYLRPGKHLDSAIVSDQGRISASFFFNFSGWTNTVDSFQYDEAGNITKAHAVYRDTVTGDFYEGDYAFEYVAGKTFDLGTDPLGKSLDPLVPPFQIFSKNLIRKVKMPYALNYTGHDEYTYDYVYNDLGFPSMVTVTKREFEFDVTLRPTVTTQTKILYYNCN